MAFFDDLSRTLSDKGKEAAQKAKGAAEVLQIRAQIASEKSKLKELYGAVGVLYYKKHQDEEDNEFGDLFREIGNVLTNVAVMEEKIQELEGAKVCPNCKKVMKKDALFCCYCGSILKKETEEEEEEDDIWEDEDELAQEVTEEETCESEDSEVCKETITEDIQAEDETEKEEQKVNLIFGDILSEMTGYRQYYLSILKYMIICGLLL